MGENTNIQWAHHSWNPWWGCQRVSPGCEHCYAEMLANRLHGPKYWGPAKTTDRKGQSEAYWRAPLKWERKAEREGTRFRVFPSMCDPFEVHPRLGELRARFWELVEGTPHLDWLLLTKRPENALDLVPAAWRARFPDNVWFGFSAEDQEWYERRIGHAARVNAVVRFVSAEPLLGPIDFGFAGTCPADWGMGYRPVADVLDWVIFGGESGRGARPLHTEWMRNGVRQCRAAGVAPFVKQLGANPSGPPAGQYLGPARAQLPVFDRKGGNPAEWPEDLRVREFPEAV